MDSLELSIINYSLSIINYPLKLSVQFILINGQKVFKFFNRKF